ncbi:MAG: AbrB/MazE/SpoVT family DNA-binding domain-containing protein [Bacteroidales bacterium]
MKVPIIRIGNSKGILLNKTLLNTYGFEDQLEVIMKENHIELKPVQKPRAGWEESFKEMHRHGEDRLILDVSLDDETLEEWK